MLRGSRLEDFDVRVGDALCVPESVNDTHVVCRPPTNKPNRDVNDVSCEDDALPIDVRIHVIYYESVAVKYMKQIQ